MRKLTCLLLPVCLLLANKRLLAQDPPACFVTISTSTGTTQLNCKDDKITLTATATGAETYTYTWWWKQTQLSFADTAAIQVQDSGTYTVLVKGYKDSILQCTTSSSIVITQDKTPPNFTMLANPNTICRGQSSTLYALGVADFLWDFGSKENAVSVSPIDITTYKLTGTAANGCSDTKMITVFVNQPPTASITGTGNVCQNEPQPLITFTAEGGKQPYTFAYNIKEAPAQPISTTGEKNSVTIGVPTSILDTLSYNLVSVTDGNNCSQPQSGTVITQILKGTSFTSAKTASACNNALFVYKATSSNEETNFAWIRLEADSIKSTRPASGSTSTINDTLLNTTSAPQLVRYAFTLSTGSGGCTVKDTLQVTVNPTPRTDHVDSIAYCNGSRVSSIKFTSPSAGASFRWTCDTSIGFGLSGKDSIPVFIASNPGNTAVVSTIKVFALTGDGCSGESTSFPITVLPAPVLTSKKDTGICNNTAFTYTAKSSAAETSFSWTRLEVDGIKSTQPASGTTNTIRDLLVNSTSYPVIVKYRFTLSAGSGCGMPRDSVQVTVNPTPGIHPVNNFTYCNGTQVSGIPFRSPSDGPLFKASYRWTIDTLLSTSSASIGFGLSGKDSIPIFTASNPGNTAVVSTVKVYALTGNGCSGDSTSFTIKVLPAPVLTSAKLLSVCSNAPFTYLATSSDTTNFKWTRDSVSKIPPAGGASVSSGRSLIIKDSLDNSTSDTVKVTYRLELSTGSGCGTTRDSVVVTLNPSAKINRFSDTTFCNGTFVGQKDFTSPTANVSYRWSVDTSIGFGKSGSGSIPAFTASNLDSNSIMAKVTVRALAGNGCMGESTDFDIKVLPKPVLTSAKSTSVCDTAVLLYEAKSSTAAAITTFNWTRNAVNGVDNLKASRGTSSVPGEKLRDTTSLPVDVIYYFTLSTGIGCSATDSVRVTVNPTPILNRIPDSTFCNGTLVNGIPFSTRSPDSSFIWTSTTSIGFGKDGRRSIPVFTATNTSDTVVTARINVKASARGCAGTDSTFIIKVNPSPPKPNFSSMFTNPSNVPLELCSGAVNINFNVNSPSPDVTYKWTSIPNSPTMKNAIIKNDRDSNTVISFPDAGIYTIKVTDTSKIAGSCINVDSQTVKVIGKVDAPRKIIPMQPGNLLVYPDNTLSSYEWGYDSVINNSSGSSYSRPIPVQGQVNQFFIPAAKFIDPISNALDTVKYKFWVLLQNNGKCFTRVYYNGLYSTNRVIANPPAIDSTVKLQIIPNPSRGVFNISLKGNIYGNIRAQILNAMGETVFIKNFTKGLPAVTEKINAGNLPRGVYFLTLRSSDLKTVVSRFVIQR